MNVILNEDAELETRLKPLLFEPGLGYEAVFVSLDRFRIKKDPRILDFIHEVAQRAPLPVNIVLDIARRFRESRPDMVKRALFLNVKSATEDIDHLPDFLREYFISDLPLESLKVGLNAAVTDRFHARFRDIPPLLLKVATARAPQKAGWFPFVDQLRKSMAQHIFSMYATVGITPHNSEYFTLCLGALELGVETIRTLIAWLPSLSYDGNADVIDLLKRRIAQSRIRAQCFDEYILLDDAFQTLRKASGTRRGAISNFLGDHQNVHSIKIGVETAEALDSLDAKYATKEVDLKPLYENPSIEQSLYRIDNDPTNYYGRTLAEILRLVYIWSVEEGNVRILVQELQDMTGTCSSGHYRRLINVMNGFLFDLEISNYERVWLELYERATFLIQAQPNCGDIVADLAVKGVPFVNATAKEMMAKTSDWDPIMEARRRYLFGE